MLLRIGPSVAPATSIASSHRVPPTKSPRRCPPREARACAGRRTGHAGTSRAQAAQHRLGRRGQVGAPGPQQRELDRGVEPRGVRLDLGGDLGGGGLETSTISSTDGVGVEPAQRAPGGEPAHRGGEVATADAEGVARRRRRRGRAGTSSCWQPVPDAATMPDRSGRTSRWRSRGRRPPTTAVPQSGPITSSAALGGGPLERDLLLDGHVVAEDHHVASGVERRPSPRRARWRRGPRPAPRRRGRRAGRSRSCAAVRRRRRSRGHGWSAPS